METSPLLPSLSLLPSILLHTFVLTPSKRLISDDILHEVDHWWHVLRQSGEGNSTVARQQITANHPTVFSQPNATDSFTQ